jgi:hypothetical protein
MGRKLPFRPGQIRHGGAHLILDGRYGIHRIASFASSPDTCSRKGCSELENFITEISFKKRS